VKDPDSSAIWSSKSEDFKNSPSEILAEFRLKFKKSISFCLLYKYTIFSIKNKNIYKKDNNKNGKNNNDFYKIL
jgi:hypothetical protein